MQEQIKDLMSKGYTKTQATMICNMQYMKKAQQGTKINGYDNIQKTIKDIKYDVQTNEVKEGSLQPGHYTRVEYNDGSYDYIRPQGDIEEAFRRMPNYIDYIQKQRQEQKLLSNNTITSMQLGGYAQSGFGFKNPSIPMQNYYLNPSESVQNNPLISNYNMSSADKRFDLNYNDGSMYEPNSSKGISLDINDMSQETNTPDAEMQQRMAENKYYNTMSNNYTTGEDEDGNAKDTSEKQYNNRVNIMNPFGGVSLDYALNYAGRGFATGNASQATIGTGLSLLKGTRNFLTGFSTGKEDKRVAQEMQNKQFERPVNYLYSQQGKEMTNADVIAKNAITDEGQNSNINMEDGEFVLRNNGQVQPVVGEPHIKNGKIAEGVNANLNAGDKVISDYVKLRPQDIKELKDRYNVALKKGTTFAQAQKKIDNKLGVTQLETDKADILKRYESIQKQEDSITKQLNLSVLEKSISNKNEKLGVLSNVRANTADFIFNLQEEIPKQGTGKELYDDNGNIVEDYAQQGGKMIKRADGSYSRRGLWDNIRANRGSGKEPTKQMLEQGNKIKKQQGGTFLEELANKHNIPLERVIELMNAQQSGVTIDKTYVKKPRLPLKNLPKRNLSVEELEALSHQFRGEGAYGTTYVKKADAVMNDIGTLSQEQRQELTNYMNRSSFSESVYQGLPNFGRMFGDGYSAADLPIDSNLRKQQGGKYLEELANKHNIPLERAMELMNAQQGGMQSQQEEIQEGQASNPQEEQGEVTQEQQIMQMVVQALQQGTDPQQIVEQLVKMNVPQETAVKIVQGVMQQSQPQSQQNEDSQMAQQGGYAQLGKKYGKEAETEYVSGAFEEPNYGYDELSPTEKRFTSLANQRNIDYKDLDLTTREGLNKLAGRVQAWDKKESPNLTQDYGTNVGVTKQGINYLLTTPTFKEIENTNPTLAKKLQNARRGAFDTDNFTKEDREAITSFVQKSGDKNFAEKNYIDNEAYFRGIDRKTIPFKTQADLEVWQKEKGNAIDGYYKTDKKGIYVKGVVEPETQTKKKEDIKFKDFSEQNQTQVVDRVKNIMPNFEPYIPFFTPIQPIAKQNVFAGRAEPIKMTPEPMLAEQERQRLTDVERVEQTGMSPQQQEAILAQGLASSQMASNDAISKVEGFNAQSQQQADNTNLNLGLKEQIMNNQFSADYQDKMMASIANQEDTIRNIYKSQYLQGVQNRNDVTNMNRANMLNNQFAITDNGVIALNNKEQKYNFSMSDEERKYYNSLSPENQFNYIKAKNLKARSK